MKTGVLLINLGSPDSPSVVDVRKFLCEFLMDKRVIDLPSWRRFLLVHFLIVPFRTFKLTQVYRQLWQPQGHPLKVYGRQIQKLLQQALGDDFQVELAMRYQHPGIPEALSRFEGKNLKSLVIIPLYPQYASASSVSTIEAVMKEVKKWKVAPELKIIKQFYDHPLFIKSFAEIGRNYMAQKQFDHYLFSYHGLPEGQDGDYRAQCFETTRLLAEALGIKAGHYTVCFQSRVGPAPWIKPYTGETIRQLTQRGIKSVLIFSPSFVADCLETTVEIGMEYKRFFEKQGGERWQMVESLNAHPVWIECLKQLVLQHNLRIVDY
jgi:ferrochelatase